ncbi:MAG: hypothetical protein Q4E48_12895 [Prevotella sp.]|nr:hypothetical protein [Prevotella sp.]
MRIHIGGFRIALLLFLLAFGILWFRFAYYPFCQLDQIESDYGNATINETILSYEERIKTYRKALFLTKGMSFKDIPYKGGKVTVDFGWDNCITISSGNFESVIHIDRICCYRNDNTNIIGKYGEFVVLDRPLSEDSVYIGIGFWDKNNNSITIYKQSNEMPYGNKKYGFYVDTNRLKFVTGRNNCFNY